MIPPFCLPWIISKIPFPQTSKMTTARQSQDQHAALANRGEKRVGNLRGEAGMQSIGKRKRVRNFTPDDRAAHRVFEKSRREAFREKLIVRTCTRPLFPPFKCQSSDQLPSLGARVFPPHPVRDGAKPALQAYRCPRVNRKTS